MENTSDSVWDFILWKCYVIFIDFKGVAVETVILNPKESLRNSIQFNSSWVHDTQRNFKYCLVITNYLEICSQLKYPSNSYCVIRHLISVVSQNYIDIHLSPMSLHSFIHSDIHRYLQSKNISHITKRKYKLWLKLEISPIKLIPSTCWQVYCQYWYLLSY